MTIVEPPALPVQVDPTLAESVVRRVLTARTTGDQAVVSHATRVEPLYDIDDERERAAAFERLALAEFEELGLADLVRVAIEARPAVAGGPLESTGEGGDLPGEALAAQHDRLQHELRSWRG